MRAACLALLFSLALAGSPAAAQTCMPTANFVRILEQFSYEQRYHVAIDDDTVLVIYCNHAGWLVAAAALDDGAVMCIVRETWDNCALADWLESLDLPPPAPPETDPS